MDAQEHARTERGFLNAADVEFAVGDVLQGSEKLWGAACHAIIALAQRRVWKYGSHYAMINAARNLAAETGEDFFLFGFKYAEKLHINFYHGFMDEPNLEEARQIVREFVNRVLAIIDPGNGADTDMGE